MTVINNNIFAHQEHIFQPKLFLTYTSLHLLNTIKQQCQLRLPAQVLNFNISIKYFIPLWIITRCTGRIEVLKKVKIISVCINWITHCHRLASRACHQPTEHTIQQKLQSWKLQWTICACWIQCEFCFKKTIQNLPKTGK